jgi:hypothetical protein
MLRFAQSIATISTARAAIGPNYGWNYQSVEEQDRCTDDE